MKEFFKYEDPIKNKAIFHTLNFYEWIIPIIVLFSLIFLLYHFKETIQNSLFIDYCIRLTFGCLIFFFLVMHTMLEWINDQGVNLNNLPLQLCSITMILCIIVSFNKSKTLHAFILYAGVMGGFSSLVVPMVGYSYEYFRYYQFMAGHILIVLFPIYFLIIYRYIPTFKTTVKVYLILQIMVFFIIAFNTTLGTDYFFLTLDKSYAVDNTLVQLLGGYPWYILSVEIIGILIIYLWYGLIKFIFNHDQTDRIQIPVIISENNQNALNTQ